MTQHRPIDFYEAKEIVEEYREYDGSLERFAKEYEVPMNQVKRMVDIIEVNEKVESIRQREKRKETPDAKCEGCCWGNKVRPGKYVCLFSRCIKENGFAARKVIKKAKEG